MRLAIAISAAVGLFAAIAGVLLHMSFRQAHAYSCPPRPPMIGALESADSAFVGKVISIDSQQIKSDGRPTFEDIMEFETSRVWRGEPYETMFVRTTWVLPPSSDGPPICLRPLFTRGVEYIVFVWEGETHLSTNSSTQELRHAPKDQIKTLGVGKTPVLGSVSPIPDREGQPVEWWSRGVFGLKPRYAFGSIFLLSVGLAVLLYSFWSRRRFRQ